MAKATECCSSWLIKNRDNEMTWATKPCCHLTHFFPSYSRRPLWESLYVGLVPLPESISLSLDCLRAAHGKTAFGRQLINLVNTKYGGLKYRTCYSTVPYLDVIKGPDTTQTWHFPVTAGLSVCKHHYIRALRGQGIRRQFHFSQLLINYKNGQMKNQC